MQDFGIYTYGYFCKWKTKHRNLFVYFAPPTKKHTHNTTNKSWHHKQKFFSAWCGWIHDILSVIRASLFSTSLITAFMHACLPACLPPRLPAYLPACLPAYLPTYIHTYLTTYLPTHPPTHTPIHPHTHPHTHLHTYLPKWRDRTWCDAGERRCDWPGRDLAVQDLRDVSWLDWTWRGMTWICMCCTLLTFWNSGRMRSSHFSLH